MMEEDYSESSSVRMEREMEVSLSRSSAAAATVATSDQLNDDSTNSFAAIDHEIQRMSSVADKLLLDILGDSAAPSSQRAQTTTADDEDEGEDQEIQQELEALDEVSRVLRKSLDRKHNIETPLTSPWKFPVTESSAVPDSTTMEITTTTKQQQQPEFPHIVVGVVVVWGMVVLLLFHAQFRLVDENGYLRLIS